MRSQDFLATVLPTSGNYCAVELNTVKKEHVYVKTIQEMHDAAVAFDKRGLDAYYALATFDGAKKREAKNAVKIKSLFLDIDCNGKGIREYASKGEAAEALDAFLSETALAELGTPWIVSSGGGLHVYWPFTEEVDIAEWKPVAENLKRLCKKHEFKIDFSVTGDASRILRVPDTFNYKKDKPRRVKIMVEASPQTFDFQTVADALRAQMNGQAYEIQMPKPKLDLPGTRPNTVPDANKVVMVENTVSFFRNIEQATAEGTGCEQLAYYQEHATEDGMEPLWFALISLARRCEDGFDRAKVLADMHPYDYDRLVEKWNHTKGPTPCIKFDTLNPGVCDKCPHFGKITNPLIFSREYKTNTEAAEIIVSREISTEVFQNIVLSKPAPPKGFSYGDHGGIYIDKVIEDADGTKMSKQIMVLGYDLFVTDILHVEGEHLVHMTAMRKIGMVELTFPQKAIISKDETLKALASQNIVAAFGAGNDKNLFEYTRACVERASANKSPIKVPNSYGWQADNTFVYSSSIYSPDGSKIFVPMPNLTNINSFCVPTGDLDTWRDSVNMLIARELWNVLAMGLVGPASLLMGLSNHSGIVYHMGSSESGTGKSLAQMLAASFYGHPEKYKVAHSTSSIAAQQRAGFLKNLPLIMDEITAKNRNDFEWMSAHLLDKTQGKGKDRSESGANKERVNTTEWKNMDLLSSNTHVLDYFGGARSHSSHAEIMRLLELKLTEILEFDAQESQHIINLKEHYGVSGEKYIRWLVTHRQEASDIRKNAESMLKEQFGYSGDERYWFGGNSCIIAAIILLGKKYSDVIDIPMQPIMDVLRTMVDNGREALRGSKRSAEDILNAYTRENYGKFIVVKNVEGKLSANLGGQGLIDQSISRSQIAGRVEHDISPNRIDYYIEISQLKAHCAAMSHGYADMVKELSANSHFKVWFERKNMLARTRGPETRMYSICISTPVVDDERSQD